MPEADIPTEPKGAPVQLDPWSLLKNFPSAPTKETVETWKVQAPNATVRFFSPDGKRVFLLRGLNGLEWKKAQKMVPETLKDAAAEEAFTAEVVTTGTLWNSMTRDGKLEATGLDLFTAGLPSSLFAIISMLSDFYNPMQLEVLSVDL